VEFNAPLRADFFMSLHPSWVDGSAAQRRWSDSTADRRSFMTIATLILSNRMSSQAATVAWKANKHSKSVSLELPASLKTM
jgi:hypothetical protein